MRDRIAYGFATAIAVLWLVAGLVALLTGEAIVFQVATGPLLMALGYVFGIQIVKNGKGRSNGP